MGKQMKNAPVFFMVTQVRFNPVLSMDVYIASIQEKMRTFGFPDFKREIAHQLVFPGKNEAGQTLPPTVTPQTRFIFGNIDGTSGFVFDNNSLAFQTTAYGTYESFLKIFMGGIKIIHDSLNLNFTERIGLRYLDAVIPQPGESLSDYFIPEVLGLSQKLPGTLFGHSFSETATAVTAGHLISRVVIQAGQVGLPVDLASLAPKINTKFTTPSGIHAILDTDAFYGEREKFDLEKVNQKIDDLHKEIKKAFSTVVTTHALAVWE